MKINLRKLVICASVALARLAQAEDAIGDWGGLLAGQLHVVIHVAKDDRGGYRIDFRSPDQGDFAQTADGVEITENTITFSLSKIGGSYSGAWDPAKQAWVGAWKQGQSIPLSLSRLDARSMQPFLAPKRPQEEMIAATPQPYQERDVTFTNPSANVSLRGTLSIPDGKGPFPSVVLISGSGRQTRDEEFAGHKIFLVLADSLSRRGIAVLRYDKRGVGASTGNFAISTPADFAADAEAAINYLKTRPEVDAKRIGLIGHSEGGAIAPAVAARNTSVAFTVLLAGPGMRTDKLTVMQEALIAQAQGVPPNVIAKRRAFQQKLFAALLDANTEENAAAAAKSLVADAVESGDVPAEAAIPLVRQVTSPWFRQALRYDPVPNLQKLRIPVLALNGSLDLQVPAAENLALIRKALEGNHNVEVRELPGLNHLFQSAKTGSPAEYGQIEETVSPTVLKMISDWITTAH